MFLEEIPIGIVVSDITKEVPCLRHVTSNIFFLAIFSSKLNVVIDQAQGQTSRSRSYVKGQGHVFSTIVVVIFHKYYSTDCTVFI